MEAADSLPPCSAGPGPRGLLHGLEKAPAFGSREKEPRAGIPHVVQA